MQADGIIPFIGAIQPGEAYITFEKRKNISENWSVCTKVVFYHDVTINQICKTIVIIGENL